MAEHDRVPVTAPSPSSPPRKRPGKRGGGRSRADQAIGLMYAASYLMNAPGTQQLLHWGGAQARDLVGGAVNLVADHQRLASAGAAWHASGRELQHTADQLRTGLAALAQPAGGPGWDSAAAAEFRAEHGRRIDHLIALGDQHRAVGDTLTAAAEQAGRVHQVLLAGTRAAGEAVHLLASTPATDQEPAPAASVAAGWLRTGEALLAAWASHSDHAAATLAALSPESPRTP